MVTDHTQANQELMQVGQSENLDLPTQVDAKHKSVATRLSSLSGTAFDNCLHAADGAGPADSGDGDQPFRPIVIASRGQIKIAGLITYGGDTRLFYRIAAQGAAG